MVQYGGGQELWDALSGRFNIKSLLACSTGPQVGGSVCSPRRLAGRLRGAALPNDGARRGCCGEEAPSWWSPAERWCYRSKSGAIDGSEFAGPWLDVDGHCTRRAGC